MVTLTADVTEGIKRIIQKLMKKGLYKSQSEIVRDAVRHLAFRYDINIMDIGEIRKITKKAVRKSKESLSLASQKMRKEII